MTATVLSPDSATRSGPARRRWLAVVTSGFPRRSETFLLNELLALEESGALGAILATGPGDGSTPQPGAARLAHRVQVLPQGSAEDQAGAASEALAGGAVTAIHGYFAHAPAAVAARTARLLGIPYGFSVHARDARKAGEVALGARARGAACVIVCNGDAAAEVRRSGGRPTLVPHGVDLDRFRPGPPPARGPLRLLAVGRLVEKKGFDVLVEALRHVDVPVRLRIVGEGPQRDRLARAISAAGLQTVVDLRGALSHAELPDEYAAADVVVAPSLTDAEGDRDGLPNVVLEAMASGRPVVAGDAGAVSSGVVDGVTGLLVPPGESAALASAIARLGRAPRLRRELGRHGRERAERHFDLGRCSQRLHRTLEAAYG